MWRRRGLLSTDSTEGAPALTKEEYVERVRTIQIGTYRLLTGVYDDLVAGRLPKSRCRRKVRVFHSELRQALDRVAALRPPEEVAGLQDHFLVAANRSARHVGEVAEEVERGRLSCGRPLNDRIYGLRSTEQALRVLREFERRGYDFVYE